MARFVPAMAFSSARSIVFGAEYALLNLLQRVLPDGKKYQPPQLSPEIMRSARDEARALLVQDSRNIDAGLYPLEVLKPEAPFKHMGRIPRILLDGLLLHRRRSQGKTAVFEKAAREHLEDVPRYYRRNFHFQTDGYLSAKSAELYEHEVELLFGGTADAMRRLILAPLRKKFGKGDGKGLTFLEIGPGTGRTTRFVRLAFPKARIVAVDLSEPYLKHAERSLADFSRIDFMQGDGAHLPFVDGHFDAVYSVFLFHELPLAERKAVLTESRRVLKPGGFFGLVDSMQTGDHPLFDPLLQEFPVRFHEPFYRNYLQHPMQKLVAEAGFTDVKVGSGFFSKVVSS